jgi:uncharacterized protein
VARATKRALTRLDKKATTMADDTMADTESAKENNQAVFDVKLLEVFACPITKQKLRYDRNAQELISEKVGLAYPIRDGVAVLVPDEARKIGG